MAFMERQVEHGLWLEVETSNGTEFIPADVTGDCGLDIGETITDTDEDIEAYNDAVASIRDYVSGSGEIWEITLREGWGARLSAPGYMDCTEWSVFASEEEAIAYLDDNYPEEDEEEDIVDDTDTDWDVEPSQPEDDDLVTEDHRNFYCNGNLVVEVPETDDDWRQAVQIWMDEQAYYPSVWFISDHGNAHLLSMTGG